MGSGAKSNGYAEMWGGTVRTFPDERAPLASNRLTKWSEWTVPFRGATVAAAAAAAASICDAHPPAGCRHAAHRTSYTLPP